ncbi:sodium:proton antiporter [Halomonas litopenaei]|uniref:Sodium:proton antiporter n=1 Tax=Halomonas litopenaei TaxID=2109328 RepID=A0ABX5IU39_9GAMM|nr:MULTISPECIES: Na+/H+ antiporter NhaC family protein [Halomonas]MBY5942731.1 sodium:proton antiporter [Halomonas sp. DP5N14-9]PTL90962.1 sodium:proton antiporter [Halomonas sp. SYSU XM8]PTL94052.1 sodium:proton antiporter [Halomonas litopenaei]RQW71125.1 sodium:proton antiporter [Halomonas sp. YLB-10]USZ48389.1 sodium:proton antiporter [Halomonas sp. DN3]
MTQTNAPSTHPFAPGKPSQKGKGRTFAMVAGLIALVAGLTFHHEAGTPFGWISLVPSLIVLVVAIATHRTLEALAIGALSGLILIEPSDYIGALADVSLSVMMNETIAWLILVCGLMGGFIAMLEKSGCTLSFSHFMSRLVKTRRQSLLCTAVLGLLIFIDDYLNALATSAAMKRLTDRFGVSREKLAYIVDSTAAPICVLVPISTWAVYFAELLETNGATDGPGMWLYIQSIPYMLYGWVAMGLVFLVAMSIVPDLGPMKTAEARARAGQTIPDGAPDEPLGDDTPRGNPWLGLFNFVAPMAVLIGASAYFEIDLLKGVIAATLFTIVLFLVQRLSTFSSLMDSIMDGFRTMMLPLAIVAVGFVLKEVNDQLGMTQFMIDALAPYITPALLPAIVFISMAVVVFATGSSWGVFVISIPIVIPMAAHMEVSMPLVVGALLSASSFGSHACFFSDSSVLSSQGSGVLPMQHALTQLPYTLIGATVTSLGFVALGYALV